MSASLQKDSSDSEWIDDERDSSIQRFAPPGSTARRRARFHANPIVSVRTGQSLQHVGRIARGLSPTGSRDDKPAVAGHAYAIARPGCSGSGRVGERRPRCGAWPTGAGFLPPTLPPSSGGQPGLSFQVGRGMLAAFLAGPQMIGCSDFKAAIRAWSP